MGESTHQACCRESGTINSQTKTLVLNVVATAVGCGYAEARVWPLSDPHRFGLACVTAVAAPRRAWPTPPDDWSTVVALQFGLAGQIAAESPIEWTMASLPV